MSKVNVYHPCITRISYHQEEGDHDYGACIWADFEFDTINYRLQIVSDCGDYAYSWVPTPQAESFFDLCRRIKPEYLLSKLSSKTVVSIKSTVENVIELVYLNMEYCPDLEDGWEELLKIELSECGSDIEIEDYIVSFAGEHNIDLDNYDAWQCIEKDYPVAAKRIVKIFDTYIKPKIPTLRIYRNP